MNAQRMVVVVSVSLGVACVLFGLFSAKVDAGQARSLTATEMARVTGSCCDGDEVWDEVMCHPMWDEYCWEGCNDEQTCNAAVYHTGNVIRRCYGGDLSKTCYSELLDCSQTFECITYLVPDHYCPNLHGLCNFWWFNDCWLCPEGSAVGDPAQACTYDCR